MEDNQIISHIAERLKLIREIRHLTLENVAKKVGITSKQVQNYESKNCSIPITRLWQMSKVLNVTIGYFLDGIEKNDSIFNNQDLELIDYFNRIKDKKIQSDILALIKATAQR